MPLRAGGFGGSASIRFVYTQSVDLSVADLYGKIDWIGLANTKLIFKAQERDEVHSVA